MKKLENKGLIERKRSAKDERNVYIHLTEKGHKVQAEAVEIPKGLVCSLDIGEVDEKNLLQELHEIRPKLS